MTEAYRDFREGIETLPKQTEIVGKVLKNRSIPRTSAGYIPPVFTVGKPWSYRTEQTLVKIARSPGG